MSNDDQSIWICYNGEVYGWERDAGDMEQTGVAFRTRSDTEFILRAYEQYGFPNLLKHLRGMFAFAIYDRRLNKVFLARDRMGLKPLIYGLRDDGLAFGSTVRSLLPWLPTEKRNFCRQSIDAYLAHRYIPAPRTIFEGLNRLENGHYIEYNLTTGRLNKQCYWFPKRDISHHTSQAEALEELKLSVALRTVSDRPLGLFLSGGIDSSSMAAILADAGHTDLTTYTAAFPGSAFDESEEAQLIAKRLGFDNRTIPIPSTLDSVFGQIVRDLDEPFADPSSIPSWFLARETTRHVKVVIGGDGGDEIFAGYKRHAKHLRTSWRGDFSLPLPYTKAQEGKGWKKLFDEIRLPWEAAYHLRFSGFTPSQRRYLMNTNHLERELWWRPPCHKESSSIEQLLSWDLANTLPEYILRKADLCTMAHGLELRAPLLDHQWLETLINVPHELRFSQPPKRFLEPTMTSLSDLQLFQQKKRGFNPPLFNWLHNDLKQYADGLGQLLSTLTDSLLDRVAVDKFVAAYYGGADYLAEQVLQLYILSISLQQLAALSAET